MNLKKTPDDIRNKTIEEAQKELKQLLFDLEEAKNIENYKEKYKRLTLLNQHILSVFKKTSFEILSKKKKSKKIKKK
tara:strand:- start:1239 stop:1469 length:231 start_codon:yes stop_codon:yes gene_type:complete